MALEASDILGLGLAFGGPSRDVCPGRFVVLHAHDHDAVERGVSLPVATSIEAVPRRHPPRTRGPVQHRRAE